MKNFIAPFTYREDIAQMCKNSTSSQVSNMLYYRLCALEEIVSFKDSDKEYDTVRKQSVYDTAKRNYYSICKWYLKFKCPKFLTWLVQIFYKKCIFAMNDYANFLETYSGQKDVRNEILTYERIIWEKREVEIYGKQIYDRNWNLIEKED